MRIALDLDPAVLFMVLVVITVAFFWSILRIAKNPTPKPAPKEATCSSSEQKTTSSI